MRGKPRSQRLGGDQPVVKRYFLRSQNLVILVAFAGKENDITRAGNPRGSHNSGFPVRHYGVGMIVFDKLQMIR